MVLRDSVAQHRKAEGKAAVLGKQTGPTLPIRVNQMLSMLIEYPLMYMGATRNLDNDSGE
jgi:hypothetical protein